MSNGDEEPAEPPAEPASDAAEAAGGEDTGEPDEETAVEPAAAGDVEATQDADGDVEATQDADADVEATQEADGDVEATQDVDAAGAEDEGPTLEDALAEAGAAIEAEDVDEAALEAGLDAIETAIEVAETEADLDAVDATLEDVAGALESADLPEPDEDDDDADDPRADLEARIDALHDGIEDARGPYAEDVVAAVGEARSTVTDTRWTESGEGEVVAAVDTFLASVGEALDADVEATVAAPEDADPALEAAADAVSGADLDPDDDAATLAALVEAAETLAAALDDAEAWADLTTREKLDAQGFYDVLGHHKDFPVEWSALKEHEKRGNAAMVLLALESLGSEFMEEHCLGALRRMGPEEAIEPMLERADRRDRDAIEILGKIGDEAAVDTIVEYVETDSDPLLQKSTLKALGEIGSESATQAVANTLRMENPRVRSHAARALGMIGDTRAIEPLSDVLADDEEDTVRASAAWALVQIGTAAALDAASEHTDDRSYLVAAEAERAAEARGARPA